MTKGKISEGKLSHKDSFLVTILVSETTSFTGIISSLWMEATKRPTKELELGKKRDTRNDFQKQQQQRQNHFRQKGY